MDNDLYHDFAERYDLFHGPFDKHDPTVVDFYRGLFTENGVQSVLDCACGAGRDLHLFHSLGYEVLGSDVSESMLAQAHKNLNGCDLRLPLAKVDYRELQGHYQRKFDAVVCLSSSILEMPDEVEVCKAFRSIRDVLRDGGVLVLTQGTTDRQWREKPRFILAVNTASFSRLFVIDYSHKGARYNVLDIYHGEDACRLKVWSNEYSQILLRDDYERLLKACGFRSVDFYGGYRFDAYDRETSNLLITVAHK